MIIPRFRPINEELNSLHTPLTFTLSEDDRETEVSQYPFWIFVGCHRVICVYLTRKLSTVYVLCYFFAVRAARLSSQNEW